MQNNDDKLSSRAERSKVHKMCAFMSFLDTRSISLFDGWSLKTCIPPLYLVYAVAYCNSNRYFKLCHCLSSIVNLWWVCFALICLQVACQNNVRSICNCNGSPLLYRSRHTYTPISYHYPYYQLNDTYNTLRSLIIIYIATSQKSKKKGITFIFVHILCS